MLIRALETANEIGYEDFRHTWLFWWNVAVELAQVPIHFSINDMQISEDLQLIVGHMCMQWLSDKAKTLGSTHR